jgi:hypothetical protein
MSKLSFVTVVTIFLVGFVATGSFLQTTTVAQADVLETNDITEYYTNILDNISYTIDPATSPGLNYKLTGGVYHLDTARVTASTLAYDRSDFEAIHGYNSMHCLPRAQVVEAVRLEQQLLMPTLKILAVAVANDTSEASGENFVVQGNYKVADYIIDEQIDANSSQYLTWPTPEPQYQSLADDLAANLTDSDFVDDVALTDTAERRMHVSSIDNIEDTQLRILRENIAANYSTTADIIDPSRVHILDYDFNVTDTSASVLDIYISDHIQTMMREQANSYLASVTIAVKIFGCKVAESHKIMRVNADILGGIFGGIMNLAKAVVSAPLTAANTLGNIIKTTASGLVNMPGAIANAALSLPSTITKTIAGAAGAGVSTFTQTCGLGTPGSMVANAGKLGTDAISTIIGGAKSVATAAMSYLPFIVVGGGALAIIGLLLYVKYVHTPKAEGDTIVVTKEV